MKPAAFLDRDGTLIEERNYLSDANGLTLIQGATKALKLLRERGYLLILVSNQSGIGRGYFDETALQAVHERLQRLLEAEGISLDGIYYCPHTPEDGCACRKPGTGMVEAACRDFAIDREHSLVIGDKAADIALAQALNLPGLLVESGHGREYDFERDPLPYLTAADIAEAVTEYFRRTAHRATGD